MYNVLAITNRHLCKSDFLKQIEKICILNDKIHKNMLIINQDANSNYNLSNINSISIVLREKDLNEHDYEKLALRDTKNM